MNKAESKFRNTSIKMHEALFRLLQTKHFEDISISDLCNEAKVNRSTFYSHYTTIKDLLQETHTAMLQQLFAEFQAKNLISTTLAEVQQSNFVHEKFLIPYLEFVKENKARIKIYMKYIDLFQQASYSDFWFRQISTAAFNAKGIRDQKTIEYMYKFYLVGCNTILMQWLQDDCQDSIEFVADIITRCVRTSKR